MAEEKEKKEESKAPQAEAEAAKPAGAPAGAEGGEAKKPKLSRLSLKEVEAELKKTQEKMGGAYSRYARFLLARKQSLVQHNN